MEQETSVILGLIDSFINKRQNESLLNTLKESKLNFNILQPEKIEEWLLAAAKANNLTALLILHEYGVNFDIRVGEEQEPILDYLIQRHIQRKPDQISYGDVALLLHSLGVSLNEIITSAKMHTERKKYDDFFSKRPQFKHTQEFLGNHYLSACKYGLTKCIKSILDFKIPKQPDYKVSKSNDSVTPNTWILSPSPSPSATTPSQLRLNPNDSNITAIHSGSQSDLLQSLEQIMPADPRPRPTLEHFQQMQRIQEKELENDPNYKATLELKEWEKQYASGNAVVSINYQDPQTGNTGLHVAKAAKQDEVCQLLVSLNIDVTIKNNSEKEQKEALIQQAPAKTTTFQQPAVLDDSKKKTFMAMLKPTLKSSAYSSFKASLDGTKRRQSQFFSELIDYAKDQLKNNELKQFNEFYNKYNEPTVAPQTSRPIQKNP